jgi:hypothetical protein
MDASSLYRCIAGAVVLRRLVLQTSGFFALQTKRADLHAKKPKQIGDHASPQSMRKFSLLDHPVMRWGDYSAALI